MINKFHHPEIAWLLAHWPAFVLLPTIFVVLALLMWRWDRKDKEAQVANYYGRARR